MVVQIMSAEFVFGFFLFYIGLFYIMLKTNGGK